MRRIYFIRHATPAVQPNVPASEWPLADRGIEEARARNLNLNCNQLVFAKGRPYGHFCWPPKILSSTGFLQKQ